VDERQMTRRGEWSGHFEQRPRIRPPRSQAEVVCLLLTAAGLLALLALTAYWWPRLPAIIPTHFGVDGRPNAYGSKATILYLPALLLLLTTLFSVLARYPWIFNYPVDITPENAARQYRRGRTLLAVMNAVMATLFAVIQWQIIQTTLGAMSGLGVLFSPAVVIALIALIPIPLISMIVWWSSHSD
jgi:uncharacterized membrane protein